jgi:hypothetical protein
MAAASAPIATVSPIPAFPPVSALPAASAPTAKIPPRRAVFAGTRLTHRDGAAVKGFAMELINGPLPFLGRAHGDKAKTARALGGPVKDEVGIGDRSDPGKKFFQRSFRGLEGEVADIQFHIQWGGWPSAATIKTGGVPNAEGHRVIATGLQ